MNHFKKVIIVSLLTLSSINAFALEEYCVGEYKNGGVAGLAGRISIDIKCGLGDEFYFNRAKQ